MQIENAGIVAAEERAHIAQLLSRYPDNLSVHDADEITNWFDRIATAADHRALAHDPLSARQYKEFLAAHHARTKPGYIGRTVLLVGAATAVVGALSLMAS